MHTAPETKTRTAPVENDFVILHPLLIWTQQTASPHTQDYESCCLKLPSRRAGVPQMHLSHWATNCLHPQLKIKVRESNTIKFWLRKKKTLTFIYWTKHSEHSQAPDGKQDLVQILNRHVQRIWDAHQRIQSKTQI